MSDDTDVSVRMTDQQAAAVQTACFLYARVCTGHLGEIASLMQLGIVPMRGQASSGREVVQPGHLEQIAHHLTEIKRILGHAPGSGLGIAHPHVHASARDAWDIRNSILRWDDRPEVKLIMTLSQAHAVSAACDFYSRICMGQIEEVLELLRMGVIPPRRQAPEGGARVSHEVFGEVDLQLAAIKRCLGHHPNSSLGIGHPHLDVSANRTYEVKKVIDRALAMHRDPNPEFKGVNYDGVTVRYTNDPVPVATVRDRNLPAAPTF